VCGDDRIDFVVYVLNLHLVAVHEVEFDPDLGINLLHDVARLVEVGVAPFPVLDF